MFREMRRKDKMKTREEALEIIRQCTNGVLSVTGDGGYPYGVPVSYVYSNEKIYFHCASEGHKLDAVKADSRVSFTVIGADNIAPDKFTTMYKSAIVFGRAEIVKNEEERTAALKAIIDKYSGQFPKEGAKYIEDNRSNTTVVGISIEHITGKGLAK